MEQNEQNSIVQSTMLETPSKQSEPDRFLIPSAIVTAGVIIALAVLYSSGVFGRGVVTGPEKAATGGAVQLDLEDDDPALGNPNAPVTLVEFSDFQCPFCRRLWQESLPQIKEKYIKIGQVKFVYRDFPLTGIHPGAEPAAMAGECAEDQGRFWEMHDKIFGEQNKLGQGTVEFGVEDLKRWAREIGLDGPAFDACLDSGKYKQEVSKDYSDGAALGVAGTPHIFVNGKPLIRGALPFEQIDQIIQQELAGR